MIVGLIVGCVIGLSARSVWRWVNQTPRYDLGHGWSISGKKLQPEEVDRLRELIDRQAS